MVRMTGHESTATAAGESAAAMVAAARSRIRSVTARDVAAVLDHDALVVDVREFAERAATGRIPGAIAAPRGLLEFWADPASARYRHEFDAARPTIVYCDSGERSALAADTLRRLGYRDVALLAGGLGAWRDCGFPMEP